MNVLGDSATGSVPILNEMSAVEHFELPNPGLQLFWLGILHCHVIVYLYKQGYFGLEKQKHGYYSRSEAKRPIRFPVPLVDERARPVSQSLRKHI